MPSTFGWAGADHTHLKYQISGSHASYLNACAIDVLIGGSATPAKNATTSSVSDSGSASNMLAVRTGHIPNLMSVFGARSGSRSWSVFGYMAARVSTTLDLLDILLNRVTIVQLTIRV